MSERHAQSVATLRVVSVFSGIAGLDSGLELAGHVVVDMCESWEPARRVLAAHYPDVEIAPDIEAYTPAHEYDVLAAGFPCTDLSHAGGKAGIFGAKSGLVDHVFRIVRETQPQWVLLENVPNLLALHSGAGMRHVIEQLDDLGYRWVYRTVDSRFTGVPQRRPRVIILASRDHDPSTVLLGHDTGPPVVELQPDQARGFYWTEGRNGLGLVSGAIPTLKGGSTLGLPSAPAVWFPEREPGQRVVLPGIEDGEALQGLPRGWTAAAVVEGERDLRWKLVGNAVTVGVGKWVGERLAHADLLTRVEPLVGDVVIRRDRRWPQAGWGSAAGAYASTVSHWPQLAPLTALEDIVKSPTGLSHRATTGFLSRVDECCRDLPAQFRRDLEQHQRNTRPPLKAASWASSESSKRRMQTQRQKDTKPEVAIRRLLHRGGLRFRLQVRPDPLMRQRIDIAFMAEKVAVDVRGCFWHRCATHGTKPKANADRWADKLDRNVARDQHTVQRLTELGWDVIVVWEHEDPKEASERIRNAVLARRAGLKATTTERAVS